MPLRRWPARPTLPANNFNELLRWMKQPGQSIKIGHAGVGSFGHLAGVLVAQELGVKVTQVPYRGAGPALIDLVGGTGRPELDRRRGRRSFGQGRQAQSLRHHRRKRVCRPAGPARPWANSATRSSTSISGTCCWCRPARRGRSSTRSTPRCAPRLPTPRCRRSLPTAAWTNSRPIRKRRRPRQRLLKREIALWGDVIRTNNIMGQSRRHRVPARLLERR